MTITQSEYWGGPDGRDSDKRQHQKVPRARRRDIGEKSANRAHGEGFAFVLGSNADDIVVGSSQNLCVAQIERVVFPQGKSQTHD